jgi:hypothetical protein
MILATGSQLEAIKRIGKRKRALRLPRTLQKRSSAGQKPFGRERYITAKVFSKSSEYWIRIPALLLARKPLWVNIKVSRFPIYWIRRLARNLIPTSNRLWDKSIRKKYWTRRRNIRRLTCLPCTWSMPYTWTPLAQLFCIRTYRCSSYNKLDLNNFISNILITGNSICRCNTNKPKYRVLLEMQLYSKLQQIIPSRERVKSGYYLRGILQIICLLVSRLYTRALQIQVKQIIAEDLVQTEGKKTLLI